MELQIPKEVRQHKESIFFGLSARQFFCALFAVGIALPCADYIMAEIKEVLDP